MLRLKKNRTTGDTIVEVLIAIAIASFAIGTSYSLANKSLQNAITASDRNQAVNIAQNQIADLKLRHPAYSSEDSFNADFGVPSGVSGPPYPVHGRDFCLLDGPTANGLPSWLPKVNPDIHTDADANTLNSSTYDTTNCLQKGQFYVNIAAEVTSTSNNTPANRTVFKISVHWPTLGGGTSEADLYYRF